MRDLKGCIFALLVLALVVSGGIGIFFQQQRQSAQARVAYYETVLAQAPCVENVCPGFDHGRADALKRLAYSELVQGKKQGTHFIRLLFVNSEEEIVGDGVVDFIINDQGIPTTVYHISIGFDDLRLESVFNILGEPDKFLFISGCGMGLRVYAELYYPEQGIKIEIEYSTRRPDTQVLGRNTPVDAVVYLQPDDFQNQISESIQGLIGPYNVAYDFDPSVTADDILAQIRPWTKGAAEPTPSADFCPR
jgi:hypothetical protein